MNQVDLAAVPKDIPLPLPAPEPLLIAVLVGFFLLHILFVNLMIGGSLLTLVYQIKGRRQPRFDRLAYEIASTITVNKSLAVVLGIGPLLAINTLYTVYFYSANALTGLFWLGIIPLVTSAFLLTYLHKYSWHAMERYRGWHVAIGGLATAIFLFVPLIFLVNVNLMLFPSKWTQIHGFWSALTLPNVFPRYAHFLLACLSLTGLFLVWLARRMKPGKLIEVGLTRVELIRIGYRWAFFATLAQFLAGPIVLITLPATAPLGHLMVVIGLGAMIGFLALLLIWRELRAAPEQSGRKFWHVAALLTLTVICMASGRHIYRADNLAPHQALIKAQTDQYMREVQQAQPATVPAQ